MANAETLEEFYQRKFNHIPENLGQDIGHFNVFDMEDCHRHIQQPIQYARRDFYKVSLMKGEYVFHYADKSIKVSGNTLIFFNPNVPYTVETLSGSNGYFCIFKEAFFTENLRGNIKDLPMFAIGSKPAYMLTDEQYQRIAQIFLKMVDEINSEYIFKYDLIRSYVTELIHSALKLQPSELLHQHTDANARITSVFSELLERQFPIESTAQQFTLRSAKDFADKLAVHVNHLNRAIKETTGKTTTHHIAERLTTEAKVLLKRTNWNISEISYCLGFEEPSHFNNFFKKHTSFSPSAYRAA
ncbi:helix-turn-helix transcriptional regulator [Mucilaginibacter sp. Bleaf8]|uniref:helix-turn-helix domain-containing protein n=1 Tax=Mucilaginibacter sp. Bleaf8 TaxID=2834430 RepID=UPI001BD0FAAB|nr:response regulator transcription factor [Mucilaginibacter sp. Bleaf8]MBS7563316.1 helix-turn-helix transcriptional regulator [Mucilaginibacter sp. Bleaf8]